MLNRIRTAPLPASPFTPTTPHAPTRDEELGKRDDDFRPARRPPSRSSSFAQPPWRWRKRRLFGALLALLGMYLFVHNIPTDLKPIDQRLGVGRFTSGVRDMSEGRGVPQQQQQPPPPQEYAVDERGEPIGAPPPSEEVSEALEEARGHYYEGPIKFYRLATSLHAITKTMGARPQNRNVLFAASSLKSVANLMPMACEMGRWDRNYVHLAITGRSPLPLDQILEINGVDAESCNVYFHDARGDYSAFSTDERAKFSVAGALKHIQDFMHPQVVITDDAEVEDAFFVAAVKARMREYHKTWLAIPAGKYEYFMWLTRLDSGSLASWYRPNVEILVHAAPKSSGSLLRFMKSLQRADFAGLKVPRLTIELPDDVEVFVKRHLAFLGWPPGRQDYDPGVSGLSLRHRISGEHLSTEQASLRFLESFYPRNGHDDHVLVLSPQVELNPGFLHYLHYAILEYRYSTYAPPNAEALMGVSLDIPRHWANGSGTFEVPQVSDMHANRYTQDARLDPLAPSPFTYGVPSTAAGLVFGDKWAELHDFVRNRIASTRAGKAKKTAKVLSETEPSWAEYLLEFMRCRGWAMLHPSEAFVTVHHELAQIPEEFLHERQDSSTTPPSKADSLEEPFLTAPSGPPALPPSTRLEADHTSERRPLHALLPFEGDLPELPHMPFISHDGVAMHLNDREERRADYVEAFRQNVGGCSMKEAMRRRWQREGRTDDLFCGPGVLMEFVDEEEVEEDVGARKVAEAIVEGTQGGFGVGEPVEGGVKVETGAQAQAKGAAAAGH